MPRIADGYDNDNNATERISPSGQIPVHGDQHKPDPPLRGGAANSVLKCTTFLKERLCCAS